MRFEALEHTAPFTLVTQMSSLTPVRFDENAILSSVGDHTGS